MKRLLIIVSFAFVFFLPFMVNAQTYSGRASVGRSAVLDTSSNYYYTDWTLLSDNSLNSVPIPYSGGQYYHMGSEYSFPITMTGDTYFTGQVKVPVVSNTIYNYTLMNGLNQYDVEFGIHQNWGVYNVNSVITNMVWECQTYSHLGIAHNYCNYVINFQFSLPEALNGAYNLNFKVLNTTGARSSYYYDGYDSNGNAIEFPVASSNSGYPTLSPTVQMNSTGGSSGGDNSTEEILEGISQSTDAITDTIQESYENLVKSQEVCSTQTFVSTNFIGTDNYALGVNNNEVSDNHYFITDYIPISSGTYTLNDLYGVNNAYCLYNEDKSSYSCTKYNNQTSITFNNSSYSFIRFTVLKTKVASLTGMLCSNGNQALYDSLTDSNVNIGGTIFDGVTWYTNGKFSDIITSPLNFLNTLNQSCTPITLTLFNKNVTLPCGTTIFWERDNEFSQIGTFRIFWNTLFAGLIIYRLSLQLIMAVNDCLDPTKDKVGGFDI